MIFSSIHFSQLALRETISTYHFKNIQLVLSCLPILVLIYTYRHKHSVANIFFIDQYLDLEIMISSTSKFYTVFMFICLVVLLISASEEEEKICEINYHHTQSEYGCDKSSCNEVCINIEHATYGDCLLPNPYFSFCYCLYKCWA